MSRARRSVSDKDIQQYDVFRSKLQDEANEAGAGTFSFDDVEGNDAVEEMSEDDLYG